MSQYTNRRPSQMHYNDNKVTVQKKKNKMAELVTIELIELSELPEFVILAADHKFLWLMG